MHTIAFPWIINFALQVTTAISSMRNAFRFAADDADTSADADADSDEFADDAWEGTDGGDDDGDDDWGDFEDDSDDEDSEEKEPDDSAKLKTALHQKKRYRERAQQAEARLAELDKKEKNEGLDQADKKEQQAEQYLANKIKEVMSLIEQEQQERTQAEQQKFDAEVEEVLDENSNLDQKELVDLANDLEISPKKAAKVLLRERSKGKTKPNLPKEKRASTTVKKPADTQNRPKSFDEVARAIKSGL